MPWQTAQLASYTCRPRSTTSLEPRASSAALNSWIVVSNETKSASKAVMAILLVVIKLFLALQRRGYSPRPLTAVLTNEATGPNLRVWKLSGLLYRTRACGPPKGITFPHGLM